MTDSNTTGTAAETLSEISARVYRAQAIVAATAVAAGADESQAGLEMQGALEAASEMLLILASDVAQLEGRVQWAATKPEEVLS
jgi:hypothetical protein